MHLFGETGSYGKDPGMILDRATLITLAAAGSGGMLAAAFAFQYIGGLAPCQMCLWQRWPHAAALLIGLVGMAAPLAALAWAGALAALSTAAIGAYHTGVERKWWQGPTSCSGGGAEDLGVMSGAELLSFDSAPGVVMCDEVAWQMFGLSMASWNMLIALALAALWIWAARRAA
jgi:disulfide bond formation protein DsbB